MERILIATAGDVAAAGPVQPWFAALCMVAACVLVVSFAVFLCGHSSGVHNDDLPRKKPMTSSSSSKTSSNKKARSMSGTVVDTTGMYTAAYGVAVVGGCSGGHGGYGGGGCGGGGGGGGCGGGGGGC